jgi:hypothetical protein
MIMGIESNEQTHGIPLLHIIIDTGEQKINSDTITFDDYTSSAKFAVKSENGKYNIWITEETLSFFELIRMMSIRSMNIEFSGGEKLNCSVSIDLNRFLELYESYLSAGGEFQDYKPVNDEFQSSFSLK